LEFQRRKSELFLFQSDRLCLQPTLSLAKKPAASDRSLDRSIDQKTPHPFADATAAPQAAILQAMQALLLLLLLLLAAPSSAQPTLWPFTPPAAWRQDNHVYLGGLFPLTGRNAEGGKQREAGEVFWELRGNLSTQRRREEKKKNLVFFQSLFFSLIESF
jgi:hypothetical protein